MEAFVNGLGDGQSAILIVGFESHQRDVAYYMEEALALCKEYGGKWDEKRLKEDFPEIIWPEELEKFKELPDEKEINDFLDKNDYHEAFLISQFYSKIKNYLGNYVMDLPIHCNGLLFAKTDTRLAQHII